MLSVLLLCVGGACGAVARYQLGIILYRREKHTFPLGTFIINITGALLLGIISGLNLSGNPYLLLGDGFCGAFTTFSTFAVESVQLIRHQAVKKSVVFVLLSVSIGLICFFVGFEAGNLFTR